MSVRNLVEGDCGGVNPLMQLGAQFTTDLARRDEGLSNAQHNDFLGHVNAQPTSFRMDTLLQEMREIEQVQAAPLQAAPKVIDQVKASMPPMTTVNEFFNETDMQPTYQPPMSFMQQRPIMSNYMPTPTYMPPPTYTPPSISGEQFFAEAAVDERFLDEIHTKADEEATSNYNEQFWQRLQDEWSKLSEDSEHPWLSDLDENYDPYKDYEYIANNPMSDVTDALSQGEHYLNQGDIPSAVLCFEAATQQKPDSAKAWHLLGRTQAENEMDPQAIAALKRALELEPENRAVLMALAVCYTNESLQNHALQMLVRWLDAHDDYKHLVDQQPNLRDMSGAAYSSMVPGSRLQRVLEVYQQAAEKQPNSEIYEALGVLYNLSSDFDKAADSFRTALSMDGDNANIWNRLGASLANGSRSAEAVQAYQRALALKPGFIRVRYNVGVCCMNLKAYAQAAEHLLIALNMQSNAADKREAASSVGLASSLEQQQQKMSSTIWSTLKMVLSLLGRNDLQTFAQDFNLSELNKAFNIALDSN